MCDFRQNEVDCPFSSSGVPDTFSKSGKTYCVFHAPWRSTRINNDTETKEKSNISTLISRALKIIKESEHQTLVLNGIRMPIDLEVSKFGANAIEILNSTIRGNIYCDGKVRSIRIKNTSISGGKVINRNNNDVQTVKIESTNIDVLQCVSGQLSDCQVIDSNISAEILLTLPGTLLKFQGSHIGAINLRSSGGRNRHGQEIQIRRSQIDSNIDLSNLETIHTLNINKSSIQGFLDLRSINFQQQVIFYESKFENNVLLSRSFSDQKNGISNSISGVKFYKCEFKREVDFSYTAISDSTEFSGVIFWEAPKFFGTDMHENTVFDNCQFMSTEPRSAAAYRAIKQKMETFRARDEEGIFFYLEMQCKASRIDSPKGFLTGLLLYDSICDMGQNFIRPLSLFFLLNLYFTTVYIGLSGPSNFEKIFDCVSYSMMQISRPFFSISYFQKNELMNSVFPNYEQTRWILFFISTFQSFTSITLLALFVLALRWRYKRG